MVLPVGEDSSRAGVRRTAIIGCAISLPSVSTFAASSPARISKRSRLRIGHAPAGKRVGDGRYQPKRAHACHDLPKMDIRQAELAHAARDHALAILVLNDGPNDLDSRRIVRTDFIDGTGLIRRRVVLHAVDLTVKPPVVEIADGDASAGFVIESDGGLQFLGNGTANPERLGIGREIALLTDPDPHQHHRHWTLDLYRFGSNLTRSGSASAGKARSSSRVRMLAATLSGTISRSKEIGNWPLPFHDFISDAGISRCCTSNGRAMASASPTRSRLVSART